MGQIGSKLRRAAGGLLTFWCPGCDDVHMVNDRGWTWNGDADRPTFQPSIRVTTGHFTPGHHGDCWCVYNAKHPDEPSPFRCSQCHSVVTDGRIAFLADSSHALAGQTVDVPDLPPHLRDA